MSSDIPAGELPLDLLQVCGGSVQGSLHRQMGRNNQDGYFWTRTPDALVAVVADGCGSQAHSEAGATLGARLAAKCLLQTLRGRGGRIDDPDEFLHEVSGRIFDDLGEAWRLLTPWAQEAYDHWLFTLVGALVTPERTLVFACGDGVWALNGEVHVLTSAENRPSYIAYGMFTEGEPVRVNELLRVADLPTSELRSLLLGTDGLTPLTEVRGPAAEDIAEAAGTLDQFWSEERFLQNPDAVRRRLALLNREVRTIDWERRRTSTARAAFADDATLVCLRIPESGLRTSEDALEAPPFSPSAQE